MAYGHMGDNEKNMQIILGNIPLDDLYIVCSVNFLYNFPQLFRNIGSKDLLLELHDHTM